MLQNIVEKISVIQSTFSIYSKNNLPDAELHQLSINIQKLELHIGEVKKSFIRSALTQVYLAHLLKQHETSR